MTVHGPRGYDLPPDPPPNPAEQAVLAARLPEPARPAATPVGDEAQPPAWGADGRAVGAVLGGPAGRTAPAEPDPASAFPVQGQMVQGRSVPPPAPAQAAGVPVAAPAPGATVAPASAAPQTQAAVPTQAAVRAQAQAAAQTVPAAPPVPPPPVRRPEVGRYPGGSEVVAGRGGHRGGRARPLPRLRVGTHLLSSAALGQIALSTPGTGLLLGHDEDRRPVSLRLFRPEPTRVTLIGGPWMCQVLMLRALALGARIAIRTSVPESWEGFGEWATGSRDRVAVLPVDRQVSTVANSHEPVLLVDDAGALGPSAQTALGPWQTQLTVLRQLTTFGMPAVQESTIVVSQRLTSAEAEIAGLALRLGERAAYLLQMLNADMLALVSGGSERYVWVTPTKVEEQLGAPRRE